MGSYSAVGSAESDCRFSSCEFNTGRVTYFRGDWSWDNIYSHSPPSADSRRFVVCAGGTGDPLSQAWPRNSVVRWTDRLESIKAVDLDGKPQTINSKKKIIRKMLKKKGLQSYYKLNLGLVCKTMMASFNLTLKAPRKKCIWKCHLLKSSAANNCLA